MLAEYLICHRQSPQRKRPWQQNGVTREGLPCAPAFACTDYKVQLRTLDRVALELRGARTTNIDGHTVSDFSAIAIYLVLPRSRIFTGYPRRIVVPEFQLLEPLPHCQVKTGTIANQIILLLKINRRALYT